MPRTCTVCSHPKRSEIDAALLRSDSLRSIVERCSISMGSLVRHSQKHLAQSIAAAKQAREVEAGESLIHQARSLHARAMGILERAEAAGHLDTALKAIRELRGILELLGKLDGQLQERATVQRIEVHYVDKQVVVQGTNVHDAKCIPAGNS
jgi:hypothetical protein